MRRNLVAVLVLVVFVTGCGGTAGVPDHTNAWLSYKFGIGCKVGSCQALTDDTEAHNYYQAIGAEGGNNSTPTLDIWQQEFGIKFNTPINAIYANQLDLQLGRDMNCVDTVDHNNNPQIVCYVTNYGPAPFDFKIFDENQNWPNLDQGVNDALAGHHAGQINNSFATVAMVYNPLGIGVNKDKVTFYVFAKDPNDPSNQILSTEAALDGEGNKSNPRMCMACHGGTYDTTTHSVTGANFLPFDVQSFVTADAPNDLASQQEAFRQLNALVLKTNPVQGIQDLVHCLYSYKTDSSNNCKTLNNVNTSGATVPDDTFVPADWTTADGQGQKVYKGLFRHYCRMCHVASTAVPFSSFSTASPSPAGSFNPTTVNAVVCSLHDMPHAEVPFGGLVGSSDRFHGGQGLWNDGPALNDLRAFLGVQPADCK